MCARGDVVDLLAVCVVSGPPDDSLDVAWVPPETAPKFVVYVAPWPSVERGLPMVTPKPISRNSGRRMFSRWPWLFIQAATMLRGVASVPVPQARFSPT